MNNPMITSPSHQITAQEARQPAYNGLYLISRNPRPSAGPAQTASAHGLTLASGRVSGTLPPSALLETHSGESVRIKLAACFGAILTAPLVWCLHTLLLSHATR